MEKKHNYMKKNFLEVIDDVGDKKYIPVNSIIQIENINEDEIVITRKNLKDIETINFFYNLHNKKQKENFEKTIENIKNI